MLEQYCSPSKQWNDNVVTLCCDKNRRWVSFRVIVDLRNRTGEERRRQALCDKRDNNFV